MKTILALTDFSRNSLHAAEYALRLAENLHTNLCLFNIFSSYETEQISNRRSAKPETDTRKHLREIAEHLVKQSRENKFLLYQPEVSYACKAGERSELGEDIAEVVVENYIGLIVMGAKGDECLSNFIPGTETYSVILHSKCPILFIPEKAHFSKINKIAIITDDGSLNKSQLLLLLRDFQDRFNTEVLFTKLGPLMQEVSVAPSHERENIGFKKPVKDIDEYELADQLQEVSGQEHIDVLGVMFHKEHLFERIFHSSTSKFLMFNANLPLLVFPAN